MHLPKAKNSLIKILSLNLRNAVIWDREFKCLRAALKKNRAIETLNTISTLMDEMRLKHLTDGLTVNDGIKFVLDRRC
jgi:hypothetical protein